MYYCKNCGTKFDDGEYCSNCGTKKEEKISKNNNESNFGWGLLGFFFPLVGLIIYVVMLDDNHDQATSAGKGALSGVIAATVLITIAFIAFFAMLITR